MATTLEPARHLLCESDLASSEGGAVAVAPVLARALPVMTARLQARHPALPAEVVEHHVHLAAVRLIRQARIEDFLPILIERSASTSLARLVD